MDYELSRDIQGVDRVEKSKYWSQLLISAPRKVALASVELN
jgi:hypothetical protein